MNEKRNNKGITLIALIITIIILLILAGVSIGIVVNGDLFDKAKETVGKANSQLDNKIDQEEEIKNVWDSVPGKIIKSATTNNDTENETNNAPTVTASVTDGTSITAVITAKGSDADGDTLTYTLVINNQTYTSSSGVFSVEGLTAQTTYSYTVTVSDGTDIGTTTGNISWCSGTGLTHNAVECYGGWGSQPCNGCYATGNCAYSVTVMIGADLGACGLCDYGILREHILQCYCGYTETITVCTWCDYASSDGAHTCGECMGSGWVDIEGTCSTHGLTGAHYYCDTHGYSGTDSTCTYCSHGKSGAHAI